MDLKESCAQKNVQWRTDSCAYEERIGLRDPRLIPLRLSFPKNLTGPDDGISTTRHRRTSPLRFDRQRPDVRAFDCWRQIN
jgi:hypothetical protein